MTSTPAQRWQKLDHEYCRRQAEVMELNLVAAINSCLDGLPCPKLAALGREVPAFRTCGITGFYIALIVLIGAGLLTGRSLIVLSLIALVSGLSFYAYAFLRRWIMGREELVLLEQVWFALACNAAVLFVVKVPLLPYLDVISVALCPFLAAGRVGCTLVGCCHGNPATVGITYNDACVQDGFSPHLAGVRLFPVPAIEATGLLIIGSTGFLALPFAAPGKVFAWYLLAYAIMRFGLEEIRGDYRPHFLGLSQARWMAIFEAGVALRVSASEYHVKTNFVYALLLIVMIAMLVIRWKMDWRRRLLKRSHLHELRELVHQEERKRDPFSPLKSQVTSRRVTVAVSNSGALPRVHVSLALDQGRRDLPLLCELAATAFPDLVIDSAHYGAAGVLHLLLPAARVDDSRAAGRKDIAHTLYGNIVRRRQKDHWTNSERPPQRERRV